MRTLTLRQRVPVAAGLLLVLSGTMAGCAQRSPGILARIWGPDSLAERAAEKWDDAWHDAGDSRLASLNPLRPDPKERDWTKDPFLDDSAPSEPQATADATDADASAEGGFASDIESQMAHLRAEMQRHDEPADSEWPAWAAHDPQPDAPSPRSVPVEPNVQADVVNFRHARELLDSQPDAQDVARESSAPEEESPWSAAHQAPWHTGDARADLRWQPVEAEETIPLIEENWQPAPSERPPMPAARENEKIADAAGPIDAPPPVASTRPARRTIVTPVSARKMRDALPTTGSLPIIRPNYALSMGRSGTVPLGWRLGSVRVTPAVSSQVINSPNALLPAPQVDELGSESDVEFARVPELVLFDEADSAEPEPEPAAIAPPETAATESVTANTLATLPLLPTNVEPAATPSPSETSSAAADRPLLLIPPNEPTVRVAPTEETEPLRATSPVRTARPRAIPDVNLDGETARSAGETRIPITLWVALGAGVILLIGLGLRRKCRLAVSPER